MISLDRMRISSTDLEPEYQQWFGNPSTQYWIGLERLHELSQSNCVIRFDFQITQGNRYFAQYTTFTVGDVSTNYTLSLSGYSGNLGFDAMSYSNNRKLSTFDADNDGNAGNCALSARGGFWYNNCGYAYINAGPNTLFRWYYTTANYYNLNNSEVRLLCWGKKLTYFTTIKFSN